MRSDLEGLTTPGTTTGYNQASSSRKTDTANAKKEEDDTEPSILDELRDKGFQTYVDEIKDRKKEELREKILVAMGLSEEQLAEMSPEQRDQIENIISEEIRRRMMAQATMNNGDVVPKPGETLEPATTGDIQNGMGSGLTLIKAMEEATSSQVAEGQKIDRDDG